MKKSKNLKSDLEKSIINDLDFNRCVQDLLRTPEVEAMQGFPQHCDYSCYDHCLYVSYTSYRICKRFGFDYKSAARGALLHDLFLYDWRVTKPSEGLHAFLHARIALQKAEQLFTLSNKEKDIIVKHMWPLNPALPRYKESYAVCMTDKYCTLREIQHHYRHALFSGWKHSNNQQSKEEEEK